MENLRIRGGEGGVGARGRRIRSRRGRIEE